MAALLLSVRLSKKVLFYYIHRALSILKCSHCTSSNCLTLNNYLNLSPFTLQWQPFRSLKFKRWIVCKKIVTVLWRIFWSLRKQWHDCNLVIILDKVGQMTYSSNYKNLNLFKVMLGKIDHVIHSKCSGMVTNFGNYDTIYWSINSGTGSKVPH